MDFFEAVARRHSYRGPFLPAAIPREDLRRIVQAGLRAPSGYNGQSTSFVVVDDPALRARIAQIVPGDALEKAPAVIVAVMDPSATPDKTMSFGVEDYAAAVENVLLAVTALGYATVWMDGAVRREGRAEELARLLEVPPPRVVRAILPVGVPAEIRGQRDKRPFDDRAWFNRYGSREPDTRAP